LRKAQIFFEESELFIPCNVISYLPFGEKGLWGIFISRWKYSNLLRLACKLRAWPDVFLWRD